MFFVFGYSLVGLCVCCVVVFCVVLYGFGLFGLFGGVVCCSILGGFIVLVCLVWFGGVLCSVLGGVW